MSLFEKNVAPYFHEVVSEILQNVGLRIFMFYANLSQIEGRFYLEHPVPLSPTQLS